jgi:AGZA family xanthine/uracil permease-like MFS transporter
VLKFLDSHFGVSRTGSSVRTEILAGVTTFLTMAYILFLNPQILGSTGMDPRAVMLATALASAFGCLAMGLVARLPFALAPGMGVNAFFAYTVVAQKHIPWEVALGAVFLDGLLFLVLSLLPIRERIIREIPYNLKLATSGAIGLFICFIGLRSAGIVEASEATLVRMGPLNSPPVALAVAGLFFMGWLLARKVRGALLLGIVAVTVAGLFVPGADGPVTSLPSGGTLVSMPDLGVLGLVMGRMDVVGALEMGLMVIVFTFTFVDLFDTAGTFVGLGTRMGWIDREHQTFPGLGRGLLVDATATMFGAFAGTSTTTTYVESASGMAEGGRTGLTAVTVGVLFLLAMVFAPLAGVVPAAATAPALILVGFLMLEPVTKLDLTDVTEALPAFLCLVIMPLTYNIANGLIWGITSYAVLKVATGRWREVGVTMWVLAILFALGVGLDLR